MVTRPLVPFGGGIVFLKALMTPRPNASFSPERVTPGGRLTEEERPAGALGAPCMVMSKGTDRSSCAGGFSSVFAAWSASLFFCCWSCGAAASGLSFSMGCTLDGFWAAAASDGCGAAG